MTALGKYNLSASDGTTPQAQLGQEINIKGATWMYIKAGAAITIYDALYIGDDGISGATSLTTTNSGSIPCTVGIAQFAFASGEYGWVPVGPFFLREDDSSNFKVNALTLCALDVKLYTTATAGAVDDTATTLISGLKLLSTVGGSTAATACVAVKRLNCNT